MPLSAVGVLAEAEVKSVRLVPFGNWPVALDVVNTRLSEKQFFPQTLRAPRPAGADQHGPGAGVFTNTGRPVIISAGLGPRPGEFGRLPGGDGLGWVRNPGLRKLVCCPGPAPAPDSREPALLCLRALGAHALLRLGGHQDTFSLVTSQKGPVCPRGGMIATCCRVCLLHEEWNRR